MTEAPVDAAMPALRMIRDAEGSGRLRVEACAIVCGADLVVTLQGGTRHHIGATAMAVPRPSLADSSRVSASASVLCVTGHKEDELARSVALRLAAALGCTVTVAAGLHVEAASPEDIAALLRAAETVAVRLAARLQPAPPGSARSIAI